MGNYKHFLQFDKIGFVVWINVNAGPDGWSMGYARTSRSGLGNKTGVTYDPAHRAIFFICHRNVSTHDIEAWPTVNLSGQPRASGKAQFTTISTRPKMMNGLKFRHWATRNLSLQFVKSGRYGYGVHQSFKRQNKIRVF